MRTERFIEALLVDENLADAIWELLDAGVITDDYAAGAWFILATNDLKRGAKDEI